MLTREQLRAARAARGWGVRELGEAVAARFPDGGISFTTISRFENGASAYAETLRRLQITLEDEGFAFLNSGRPGLQWDEAAPARWNAAPAQVPAKKGHGSKPGAKSGRKGGK